MEQPTYSGRLARWNDDKGFGFIVTPGSGKDIFLHISAFKKVGRRPVNGDTISYQIHTDNVGKTRAVNARIQAAEPAATKPQALREQRTAPPKLEAKPGTKPRSKLPIIMVIGFFVAMAGVFGYQKFEKRMHHLRTTPPPTIAVPATRIAPKARPQIISQFSCEGKVYCSDMNTCAEAIFYQRQCPGTKMDGDGDGKPCEDWCGH